MVIAIKLTPEQIAQLPKLKDDSYEYTGEISSVVNGDSYAQQDGAIRHCKDALWSCMMAPIVRKKRWVPMLGESFFTASEGLRGISVICRTGGEYAERIINHGLAFRTAEEAEAVRQDLLTFYLSKRSAR